MIKLFVATSNEGKLREIRKKLEGIAEVVSPKEENLKIEVEEDGNSFLENALKKARVYFSALPKGKYWVMADDSGLEVEALGGEPGVKSARYAGENSTQEMLISKLLKNMEGVKNRRARFVAVIVLISPSGEVHQFEGVCYGTITEEPRGKGGFGYDPVFVPEGKTETMAEIAERSLEEKNEISHRGKALEKLREFLLTV